MGRKHLNVNEQQVKDYRAAGKSQNWIALRLGVSPTVVHGILSGKRVVPVKPAEAP